MLATPVNPVPAPHPDAETIHAIRTGEVDRYRDLIDRYERQVYAVAWSRLGDPTLAEEAVQESFIKAYRYLGWLRDPGRFGAWLTRIARGIAINLGLRHQRELNRRRRWALEQTPTPDGPDSPSDSAHPAADDDGAVTPELLRSALAALPARHRECLVLHYLEGRSVADAAMALDVSEGAFRVRLHRGKGLFQIPATRHTFLWGDAQETYFAAESLRLLAALDRVPDLAAWEYRPRWTHAREGFLEGEWRPHGLEIEAVVLKEWHARLVGPKPVAGEAGVRTAD